MSYLLSFILLILSCSIGGAANADNEAPEKVVEVAVATVGSIEQQAQLIGRVKSKQESTLRARRSATIKQLEYQDGMLVKQGSVLITLDNPAVEQRYTLAREQSRLANEELKRQFTLYQKGAGSKKKFEQANVGFIAAQSEESQAKLELDHHILIAPFNGTLGNFRYSQGAYVQEGDVLVSIYDPLVLYIEFEVPGDAVSHLEKGQHILVTSPKERHPLKAEIEAIESCIDMPTQTSLVRAKLRDESTLIPGEFINIQLALDGRKNITRVPLTAVFLHAGQPHAYLVKDKKLKLVAIKTGLEGEGLVEITAGVKPNDTVVVGGQLRLKDGETVKVSQS